ncbi:MAG: efflux transporter outer membrane subunit [Pseudomonadota bacterium]
MVRLHLYILALVFSVVLAGCHSAPPRPELTAATPAEWVRAEQVNTDADDAWLETLGSDALSARVSDAVDQNYALGAARARLDQARQSAVIARAPRLPSISLSLDRNRRRIVRNFTGDALDDGVVNQVASANLDLQWQIDIWGELAASARSAAYNYAAAEATYVDARRQLAADVSRAWYALAEAQALEQVARDQLDIALKAQDIVDRGYLAGINESLDVYLARTTVAQTEDILAARVQGVHIAAANLQLLGAEYPDGQLPLVDLPIIDARPGLGVPSDLLTRRPDLQIAWLNLLSADAALAVAQRQRFPSIVLSAGLSDIGNNLPEAADGGPLGWNFVTRLTQPIFDAGSLRANARRAAARVQELELIYLNQVNTAFSEVENAISNAEALAERLAAAERNIEASNNALTRSFEAYGLGLVDYTSVLESQQRAFDAQSNLVQIRAALLNNRISLYEALGGPFDTDTTSEPKT